MDDRCVRRPRFDQLYGGEPGGDNQVGAGQKIPDELVTGHVERSREIGMILGDHALRHRGHHDRAAIFLGKPRQRFGRVGADCGYTDAR